MDLVVTAAAIGAGALAAASCKFASGRVRRQPVPVAVEAEQALLEHAAAGRGSELAGIVTTGWFTSQTRRERWTATVGDTPTSDPGQLEQTLDLLEEDLREAVIAVGVAAEERDLYQGSARLEQTGDDTAPYRWQPAPTRWWRWVAGAVLAAGVVALAGTSVLAAAGWVGLVALIIWLTTGAVLAWVDIDTLFIDFPTAGVGYGAASVLAAWASWTGDGPQAVTRGLVALAASGLIVGFVIAYSRLRGISGMGGGDFVILPALVAVPLLLGADFTFIAWAVLASAAVAVATWAVVSRGREQRRDVPFPFGPGLIVGFALTFAAMSATAL